jgi:hypothetical protein
MSAVTSVATVIAKIVDWGALWQTIWSAALCGVGVSVVFAFLVLGATRSVDHRRAGEPALALAYTFVAVLGGLATVGAVAYALYIIGS